MSEVVERSVLLREAGRPMEALRILAPYLAANPDDAEGLRQAGWSYLAVKDNDSAYQSARKAVALQPENADHHLLMANVATKLGHIDLARQAVRTAMNLAPHSAVPYLSGVSVDLQARQISTGTERLARKATELAPHHAAAHRMLGSTLLELKRYSEARQEFEQALRLDPDDDAAKAELARLDLARGRTGAAAVALHAALRLDPTDKVMVFNLKVAAANAFNRAQLVLWIGVFVAFRIRLFGGDDDDLGGLMRVVGPVLVVAVLGMWAWQLRGAPGGIAAVAKATRQEWSLVVGVALHFLGMLLLLGAAFLPNSIANANAALALVAVVLATLMTWVIKSRLRRSRPA
jgi:Flp pilus assembly protein TadD